MRSYKEIWIDGITRAPLIRIVGLGLMVAGGLGLLAIRQYIMGILVLTMTPLGYSFGRWQVYKEQEDDFEFTEHGPKS